jgi:hypothetical protein
MRHLNDPTSSADQARQLRALVLALVDALLVLETSNDNEIDPHAAVRGMENIAANLVNLGDDDQRALRAELAAVATASSDPVYAQFASEVADMVGLAR